MSILSSLYLIFTALIQLAVTVGVAAVVGYFVVKMAVKAALREWDRERRGGR
ncbi:MAG TPA: hypothetical protein IAA57_10705 [Candidatus Pullilachnospira intestinigallinarum]|nr:hypothetical protein [Candidatus Pullilachnospira intestinigallinarum]